MTLAINGKYIDFISGPVSMDILYPKAEYLKIFPKAPIFILFGDHHFDDKGYCDPELKMNRNVFDPKFLQLFSEKVGDDGVDFYLEAGGKTHDFSEENSFIEITLGFSVGPMIEMWRLFRECYRNTRMEREPAKDSGCDVINKKYKMAI